MVLAPKREDPGAAVSLENDEALLLQADQRLADRAAAHLHLRRQLVLAQPFTGRDLTGDDRSTQVVGHLVGKHPPTCRTQRWQRLDHAAPLVFCQTVNNTNGQDEYTARNRWT